MVKKVNRIEPSRFKIFFKVYRFIWKKINRKKADKLKMVVEKMICVTLTYSREHNNRDTKIKQYI